MYIRWKIKPRANEYENGRRNKPVNLHVAYLVECHRVNGKPRQKTTYLASIKDKYLNAPAHQRYFWRRVRAVLQTLQLGENDVKVLEARLHQRVPELSEEEARRAEAQIIAEINRKYR